MSTSELLGLDFFPKTKHPRNAFSGFLSNKGNILCNAMLTEALLFGRIFCGLGTLGGSDFPTKHHRNPRESLHMKPGIPYPFGAKPLPWKTKQFWGKSLRAVKPLQPPLSEVFVEQRISELSTLFPHFCPFQLPTLIKISSTFATPKLSDMSANVGATCPGDYIHGSRNTWTATFHKRLAGYIAHHPSHAPNAST